MDSSFPAVLSPWNVEHSSIDMGRLCGLNFPLSENTAKDNKSVLNQSMTKSGIEILPNSSPRELFHNHEHRNPTLLPLV